MHIRDLWGEREEVIEEANIPRIIPPHIAARLAEAAPPAQPEPVEPAHPQPVEGPQKEEPS
ncbi:MAG: hypothetical protein WAV28_04820 [Sedimentisphaerales bacterium]